MYLPRGILPKEYKGVQAEPEHNLFLAFILRRQAAALYTWRYGRQPDSE